jgi:hypothetical protein
MAFNYTQFQKFDIESLDAKVILYQSGYLTISHYDDEKNRFHLDYPNLEVRSSFAISLIELIPLQCRRGGNLLTG